MKILLKVVLPIVVTIVLWCGAIYGTVSFTLKSNDLPLNMKPIHEYTRPEILNSEVTSIMNQWSYMSLYEPTPKINNTQDVIDSLVNSGEIDDTSESVGSAVSKITGIVGIIDSESLENYLVNNEDVLKYGVDYMVIDCVDKTNTPTGVKTSLGDDVLAIDMLNGIIIIGRTIQAENCISYIKLALVLDKAKVDMSLVKNLNYWDIIETHAKDNQAVLAINASSYTWNEVGEYAILYGACKYHGELHRKEKNQEDLICLDAEGNLSIGTNIENAYNAVEVGPELIRDGEIVYQGVTLSTGETGDHRFAMSAIGQTANGMTILLNASGGLLGSDIGSTPAEVAQMMLDYGAVTASTLSGGSRSIMYWNGRVVTEVHGYNDYGVRLPNTFYVKQRTIDPSTLVNNQNNQTDVNTENTGSIEDTE